ncbi:HRDC domain-containing protein [Clostridium beijerinckii]|uniref:HRDC domain-containing protein n=1 Tax=Clostridium beijerinckii TaxID=1520 RepID=UPI00098CDD0F|nr:HRDC domain-containing protein [Clostridium beijerinckii]NRU38937.1 ribonuclease D [Clostridium beijerinckii]NSA97784.1 ribonuclease D [Clostridium beijerinckii]OOM68680.1 ribonuclease D [Clostridium beijerinckii]OOM72611.1 ribonuclease D [Clostridium beijerinckii]CUU48413.1 NERD domain protein [Clostridium beijerinckii]
MGFISNLLNIEGSEFKSITKPTAIKDFVGENDNLKVLEVLLSKLNNDEKKELVNKEIRAMKRGLQGEKTVDFELKNCILPLLYLHDIRIEYDGLTSQIDYLLITKKYICVIETKQLLGDVNINSDGEFIRVYKNKNGFENKEGMLSPIEQNKKHVNLIRKVLKEVFECDNVPVRSLVIMANPKAIIRKKYAPEEIQNQIIRAEKLGYYIESLENELRKTVLKEEMAFKIADYFKEKHTPINIDYEAKFGITEEDFSKEASINIVEKSICEVDFNDIKNLEKLSEERVDETVELSESDSQLTEKLKLYRNEKAKEEGYNALKYHYVFSGSTINNLVENKPKTTEQLLNIKGLGEVKINKYGNDILKIIEEHVANADDRIEKINDEANTKLELEIRNQLKKFRTETAKIEKIKPFMVFKDEQIDELIKVKPRTKDQLLGVKGFGEIKVEKYGEGILNVFNIDILY